MSEEYQHEQAINMNVVIPSRRERLRRPLPSPPVADPSNRGSMGGGGAAAWGRGRRRRRRRRRPCASACKSPPILSLPRLRTN